MHREGPAPLRLCLCQKDQVFLLFIVQFNLCVIVITSWHYGFKLWGWRRLLTVPWTARKPYQSILKEISPEYSLEGLMLRLKFQYFGHLMRRTDSLKKTLMLGKIEGGEQGDRDEMVGWHHRLNGYEFEQTLGYSGGQRNLVCYSPWGRKACSCPIKSVLVP